MQFLRIAFSVLLVGVASLLTATPALAHTTLKSSTPANGSSLSAAPDAVTLTFEEAVTLPKNPISVTGPSGEAWTVGTPAISGASVTAPVQASGPAGEYTLRYTVTADDGDAVKGTVKFTLTSAASPSAAAAAPATAEAPVSAEAPATAAAAPVTPAPVNSAAGSDDSGTSTWVWVAVAVIVLGVAGGIGVAVQRRSSGSGRRTS